MKWIPMIVVVSACGQPNTSTSAPPQRSAATARADKLTADTPKLARDIDVENRRQPGDLAQQIEDLRRTTPQPPKGISVADLQEIDDTSLTADAVVSKIAEAYMARIERCYQQTLAQDSSARGRLTLTLTVNIKGRTTAAMASGFVSAIDACVADEMTAWRFPVPKDKAGRPTSASFRISLSLVPS
jgi:hypothetical protein